MEAAASATIKLARLDIEAACLEGPRGVVEGARSTPETWVARALKLPSWLSLRHFLRTQAHRVHSAWNDVRYLCLGGVTRLEYGFDGTVVTVAALRPRRGGYGRLEPPAARVAGRRGSQLVGVGASLTGSCAGVIGRDQVERFRPHLLRPHLLRPHLRQPRRFSPLPASPLPNTQDKYTHMSCGLHTPACRGSCVETGWLTQLA